MISSKWGEKTAKKLKDVGLDVRFKLIDGTEHALCPSSLDEVLNFVLDSFSM